MSLRIIFISLALSILSFVSMAQCPTLSISSPDSACQSAPITINNLSSGSTSFEWDFCVGELENIPAGINYGTDSNLGFPQQLKLVKQNNNFYLFVSNLGGTAPLVRYDYGNSLENTPTIHNYPGLTSIFNCIHGMDVYNDNGNWYMFLANFCTWELYRVDLGTDISQNNATFATLGQILPSNPRGLRVVKEAGNYFIFATGGNNLRRIEFGGSLSNAPVSNINFAPAAFNGLYGLDFQFDCSLGKWVGFVSDYNAAQVHVLDYGNTLSNTPTVSNSFLSAINPTGIGVTRDGSDWHLLVLSNSLVRLQNLKMENNLLATPVQVFYDTIAQLNNPREITILKDSSNYHCYISNGNDKLSRIIWNNQCTNQPAFSTDPTSVTASIQNTGYVSYSLSATGAGGEPSVLVDSIYINSSPFPGFTNSNACEGYAVNFTDTSVIQNSTITQWSWDFGDSSPVTNTQNPSHTYSGTGTFTVTLQVTSAEGCSNTVSQTVTVNANPVANASFTNNQCETYQVQFSDASTIGGATSINSWEWSFGDNSPAVFSQNPFHVFDTSGTFNIQLIVGTTAGCTDTTNQTIQIIPAPKADFTVSETCVGQTASFSNTTGFSGTGNLTYSWNFGDSNISSATSPTHQYVSVAANYDVTLVATAQNGCSDTIIRNIRIGNPPTVSFNFTPAIVCVGNTVDFTSTSAGTGSDTISAWIWDFGDLTGSNIENPSHAFADTGYYNVTLTVTSPTSCSVSLTQQVYVIPSPTVTFTASNQCFGTPIQFNPFITTPPGTQVDSVVWDFGDGTLLNTFTSPSHLYAVPGNYQVNVTVYNNLTCTGSYGFSVESYPIPSASFTNTLTCSESEILFNSGTSTASTDTITSWLWNFANLGTSNDSLASFIFNQAGTYNITLIVNTNHGCSDTVTNPITVIQSPQFDFTFNQACFGEAVNFTYLDLITPPQPANLLWDFGDNSNSSLLNPIHLYNAADTFTVSLLVLNPNTGCSKTSGKEIIIRPLPITGFAAGNGCQGTAISFTDTSTLSNGNITSWSWDFGDGNTSNLQNATNAYSNSGNFTVSLTATSQYNCSATATSIITAYPIPDVAFVTDVLYGSPPLTVNFSNTSAGIVASSWDFGDAATSNDFNPSHIYQDTGVYEITLIGTSVFGCQDSFSLALSVLIPFLDLSVENTYLEINNGIAKTKATLINKGNITINTFQLKSIVEDNTPIIETWNGTLKPGDMVLYEFTAGQLVSESSDNRYSCSEITSVNGGEDDNTANNIKCLTTISGYELIGIYPNPGSGNTGIILNAPFENTVTMEVISIEGKMVRKSEGIEVAQGFNRIQFDAGSLARGLYIIRIDTGEENLIARFVRY